MLRAHIRVGKQIAMRTHIRVNGESYISVETVNGKVIMLRKITRDFAIQCMKG